MHPSKIEQLEALYRQIPRLNCKGLCGWNEATQDGCCGPLRMTRLERSRIVKAVGHAPKADPVTWKCNMLQDGRCLAYKERSFVCRIWGVLRAMKCPHGCIPERWMTVQESMDIQRQISEIGGPLVADELCHKSVPLDPQFLVQLERHRRSGL